MKKKTNKMHVPVLLQEVLDGLTLQPGDTCIDATLGAGGHAREMLARTSPNGILVGIDRDRTALLLAAANLEEFGERFIPLHDSYANIQNHEVIQQLDSIQAILIDLGVSSMQLDMAEKGFAFRMDGPLDMRFDQTGGGTTAADLLNSQSEEELRQIFWKYGEIKETRRLVHAIVAAREESPFRYTSDLLTLVERVIPRRGRRLHPATTVFQAIRIAVNHELDHLEQFLPQAVDLLSSGGRFAVITFHSLEDRIVKHFFKLAATDCICPPELPECRCDHRATIRIITRKPIRATDEESESNPRARSAKLRIIEKI